MDKTTGKNIIWATDSYSDRGKGYQRDQQMLFEQVIKSGFLQPRILKSLDVQKERTKKNAEVYTPAWICNLMNNQIDQDWFDDKKGFNQQEDKNWIVNADHISFLNQDKKTWKEYVNRKVLEITCGEAPFLVSRYDSSTGNPIDIQDRVGLFDRKLRVVTENTNNFEDWYKWALKALKSTYGYEFQGDSLLIGRVNVYLTLLENAKEIWNQELTVKQQEQIADIICWNLFQMDGLTDCIPVGAPADQFVQPSLFDFFEIEQTNDETTSPPVIINWWDNKSKIKIREMKEGNSMPKAKRWGVIIGNPPYQENDGGNGASAKPIYNQFVEETIKLNPDHIEMIMPSRWFNGGKGLDKFRLMMLNGDHISTITDFQNAKECFPNTSIGGGVCIIEWDRIPKRTGNLCKVINVTNGIRSEMVRSLTEFPNFVRNNDSVSILRKIASKSELSIANLMSSRNPFGLSTNTRGHQKESDTDFKLYSSKGVSYISKETLKSSSAIENAMKYKVMISRVTSEHAGEPDKTGKFKVIAKMELICPEDVCTDSYIIGNPVSSKAEAVNFYNYITTKFVRYLILQNLSSINLSKESYRLVPIQDFKLSWTDSDLYQKYNLADTEIDYIEKLMKPIERIEVC